MKQTIYISAVAFSLFMLTNSVSAKTLELKVGQTKHITAYRGESCDAGAPSWAYVARRIPKSSLVTYSDGGISSRVSNQCKKRVPTRAVNATAVKPGKETKRYQSGSVTIQVK